MIRVYARTSRRTGVSMPLWLAIPTMYFAFALWLCWMAFIACLWVLTVLIGLVVWGAGSAAMDRWPEWGARRVKAGKAIIAMPGEAWTAAKR